MVLRLRVQAKKEASVDSEVTVTGNTDESVPFLENTARFHGQTEAAACLTLPHS